MGTGGSWDQKRERNIWKDRIPWENCPQLSGEGRQFLLRINFNSRKHISDYQLHTCKYQWFSFTGRPQLCLTLPMSKLYLIANQPKKKPPLPGLVSTSTQFAQDKWPDCQRQPQVSLPVAPSLLEFCHFYLQTDLEGGLAILLPTPPLAQAPLCKTLAIAPHRSHHPMLPTPPPQPPQGISDQKSENIFKYKSYHLPSSNLSVLPLLPLG